MMNFSLQSKNWKMNICLEVGYCKPNPLMKNKDFLVKSLSMGTILNADAESRSFLEGLKFVGVLQILKTFREESLQQLSANQKLLTATDIQKVFKPQLSQPETRRRQMEEDFLFNCGNFLQCAGKRRVEYTTLINWDVEDQAEEFIEGQLTPEDVLQFATYWIKSCSTCRFSCHTYTSV